MYSRKFGGMDLPAGYGGVALREQAHSSQGEEQQREEPPSSERQERTAREEHPLKGAPPYHPSGYAPSDQAPSSFFKEENERERRRPRYPLYEGQERERYAPPPEAPSSRRGHSSSETGRSEEKTGGLLSSLFSLAGKSFTMEDIVLAGLILLLLNEKDGAGKSDNELLLILGLLLMSGKR